MSLTPEEIAALNKSRHDLDAMMRRVFNGLSKGAIIVVELYEDGTMTRSDSAALMSAPANAVAVALFAACSTQLQSQLAAEVAPSAPQAPPEPPAPEPPIPPASGNPALA